MTFTHLHDAGEFIVFQDVMARHIDRIARLVEAAGRRHLAELRRTWQTPQHINRSAAQRARWAKTKEQA